MKQRIDSSVTDFLIYSDGGGERSTSGAASCVIEEVTSKKRIHLAAFLGGATNNEAELTAGLLGFSFLKLLLPAQRSVRWLADSEYVLRSATEYIHTWQSNGWRTAAKEPVKNQGFWRVFLVLSSGIRIIPEHVRGHTGHPENELCDLVASWVREYGEEELIGCSAGGKIVPQGDLPEADWILLDGRRFVAALRSADGWEEEAKYFTIRLEALGVTDFSGALVLQGDDSKTLIRPLVQKLREARDLARLLQAQVPEAKSYLDALDQLLKG